jgi:hypothetical protein
MSVPGPMAKRRQLSLRSVQWRMANRICAGSPHSGPSRHFVAARQPFASGAKRTSGIAGRIDAKGSAISCRAYWLQRVQVRALIATPHCGQSLQRVIPIMISEPTATSTGQINGNSSSTATTAARPTRVLFKRAKREPATSIRTTPFGPQQRLYPTVSARNARP